MSWTRVGLTLLLLIPVQTVLLEPFKIGVKPDLALIIVVSQAWRRGTRVGIGWGLALGAVLDLFTSGVLGLNFFLKTLAGFVAGIFRLPFIDLSPRAYAVIFIVISVIHDVLGFIFVGGITSDILSKTIASELLIRAGINTALAVSYLLLVSENDELKGRLNYGETILSPGRGPRARR